MTLSASSPAPSRRSSAKPSHAVRQPYDNDLSEIIVPLADAMGYTLLPWQVGQLADWSAIDANGKWVHPRCGASIPRQAGKSIDGIVWAVVLSSVMGYKVLWTDHNYATTCEMLNRFRDIFGYRVGDTAHGKKDFRKLVSDTNSKTAQEWFRFKSGGVLAFSTRTKSAALGFSFDVVIYDEAQELTGQHVQAITPTLSSGAKQNPQAIYLGTPTRAGSPAEVFQNVRADALSGSANDLCWLEYGTDEVGDVRDEERWWTVNPSLGYHATPAALRIGLGDLDDLGFAQEYLGYWLPKVADAVLSEEEWKKCLTNTPPEPNAALYKQAYAVKFSPDGSQVAVAVACLAEKDSIPHVELIELSATSGGTGRLAKFVEERATIACACVVDGLAGAGALCERLQGHVPRKYLVRPRANDVVTSAAMMLDSIRSNQVTHIEQPALDTAATRAKRRKIGNSGGWGWDGEGACAIDAVSLALWALKTSKRNPKRKAVIW